MINTGKIDSGVYVANVTPFDSLGHVEFVAFEKHLYFLAENGVDGFVPCATTGESPTLNDNERRQLLSLCRKVADEKHLRIIAGCCHNSTGHVLLQIQEAVQVGANAALVVSPYYNKPTPAGLLRHFETLAEKSPLPIVIYQNPSRTLVTIPLPELAQLFQHPNIIGIKESSGQYSQWLALSILAVKAGKLLFAGDDDAFAPILALGGHGIISASANVIPREFVTMHNLWIDEKFKEVFQLQQKLYPVISALFAETNPAPVKFALKALGLMDSTLRLPLVPVKISTENAIISALKQLEYLA